ncbi:MerR family transcriptional regulator [Saccharopolyspora shandongensis]|uniref:MerR family transcriptional regulator n=1 Tax=Saccharopolyspora shandongensis TaxID=418495 RepID=UPI0033F1DE05
MDDRGVVFTISAVSRRLGVPVPTLRSWERRYGIGPSVREAGRHRRYTAADLDRLRRMIALVDEGAPPASAAAVALGEPATNGAARDGGGSGAIAVGRSERTVRGLARAAARLDVEAVRAHVETQLNQRGVERTWEDLLVPLLQSLGHRYDAEPESTVAIEHAATIGILGALRGIRAEPAQARLHALLLCAPDEQHSLPLEVLYAALVERGRRARFLGARVPSETALSAAHRMRPRTVVVWAHSARLARRCALPDLAETCSKLVLGGPGWEGVRAAQPFIKPRSLSEALQLMCDEEQSFR